MFVQVRDTAANVMYYAMGGSGSFLRRESNSLIIISPMGESAQSYIESTTVLSDIDDAKNNACNCFGSACHTSSYLVW